MDSEQVREGSKKALVRRDARLFNGRILAAEAFKWNLEQMLHFVSDAAKRPDHFSVHEDHHRTLATAVEKLEELSELKKSRAFLNTDKTDVEPFDINWENVNLKCQSQYELLGLVLSILGRAPPRATRRDHHLPLLILCVKFVILAAGDRPKKSAPSLVSIMFTDDDDDFTVQVTCDVPEFPGLENPVDGPGLSAITDGPDLNVILGSTILQGKGDFPESKSRLLRRSMLDARKDFLVDECGYIVPERQVDSKGLGYCGSCGETFGSGMLRHNTTFKGRKVGGLALKIGPVIDMEEIDDLKLDALMDPCDNCKDILRQAGVDVERFSVSLVDEEAMA